MEQLGNPLLDDYYDNIGSHEYWWNHGLISESTYKELQRSCSNDTFLFPKDGCNTALSGAYEEFGNINPYNIYGPSCNPISTSNHRLAQLPLVTSPPFLPFSLFFNVWLKIGSIHFSLRLIFYVMY